MDKELFVREPEHLLRVTGEYDVVVVGGGFAGVAAALAAARNHAKVCLIEKTCAPGGLGTLGLIVDYLPLCDGNGQKMSGGIAEELMLGVSRYDGSAPGNRSSRYDLVYNPAAMILFMEELLLREGVSICYDTLFCDVVKTGNHIDAVIIENKGGRSAVRGRFFIDTTGDADVCFASGETTCDSPQNVCAWWFYSQDGGAPRLLRKTDNFYRITSSMPLYSGTNPEDVSALCIETRRRIRDFLLRSSSGRLSDDETESELSPDGLSVIWKRAPVVPQKPALLPMIPQFRMTRRLSTPAELTEDTISRWDDTCIGMIGDWRKNGPRYCIPYRAVCAEQTENLFVAGRCIPAADAAWDITRVIPACAVTGEAAGTAAALLLAQGKNSILETDLSALQNTLRTQKAVINQELMPL